MLNKGLIHIMLDAIIGISKKKVAFCKITVTSENVISMKNSHQLQMEISFSFAMKFVQNKNAEL